MIYILIIPFRSNGLVLYMIPFTCYTTVLLPVEHASKIFYLYQIFLFVEHLATLQLLSTATIFLAFVTGGIYNRLRTVCKKFAFHLLFWFVSAHRLLILFIVIWFWGMGLFFGWHLRV